jgi:hypothetical protein
MSQLQSNPVIAQGLLSKKCTVALSLMQQDPKEAQRRFGDDPEVNVFMREFGKVMGTHFETLGSTANENSKATATATSNIVEEIGPLHAEVLKKNKEMAGRYYISVRAWSAFLSPCIAVNQRIPRSANHR